MGTGLQINPIQLKTESASRGGSQNKMNWQTNKSVNSDSEYLSTMCNVPLPLPTGRWPAAGWAGRADTRRPAALPIERQEQGGDNTGDIR